MVQKSSVYHTQYSKHELSHSTSGESMHDSNPCRRCVYVRVKSIFELRSWMSHVIQMKKKWMPTGQFCVSGTARLGQDSSAECSGLSNGLSMRRLSALSVQCSNSFTWNVPHTFGSTTRFNLFNYHSVWGVGKVWSALMAALPNSK